MTINLNEIEALFPKTQDGEVYWCKTDLLATSCYAHRAGYPFLESDFHSKVKLCDFEMADRIRAYFRNKILLSVIKGKQISAFRQDLITFLDTNYFNDDVSMYRYPQSMIGLALKLPDFYKHDIELEKISAGSYRSLTNKNKHHLSSSDVLEFKGKLLSIKRDVKLYEYWFETNDSDLVVLAIHTNNPIEPLFSRYVNTDKLKITAGLRKGRSDDIEFFRAIDWQLTL